MTKRPLLNLQFAIFNLQFAIVFLVGNIFFACSLSAALPPAKALMLDGRSIPGRIEQLDADGNVILQDAGTSRTVTLSDLVSWGACVEPRRGPVLVLADGGVLPAAVLAADKDTLQAESDRFGRLKIPMETLAGVVFRLPGSAADRDALLERILHAPGDTDRLELLNGDALNGTWESFGEDAVQWQSGVGAARVEVARLAAATFNPALRRKPAQNPLGWAGFDDGTRLRVERLVISAGTVQATVFGRTWKTEAKHLIFLQPLGGQVEYLSDRTPGEYRFTPYLSIRWPFRNDRNVNGGLLRNGGRLYVKGIGVHSAARLAYPLEGKYEKFQADLALDDSAGGGGSVRFRVLVDGREKFVSEILRGNRPPTPVTVDVAGAKQIELFVDYADRGDVQDHADWLGARVVKGNQNTMTKEIKIEGNEQFTAAVGKALALLKTKSPEAYRLASEYIGIIRQGKHSGMWAYLTPPMLEMGERTVNYSVTWCAGAIAHDSWHSKLYHDYQKVHSGGVPDEIWGGQEVEKRCMEHQLRVMRAIGAPEEEIRHIQQQDGTYFDVNKDGKYDWTDYYKRDW
jgi:hypothetical protein